MKLFIAEKPDLAKKIGEALPGEKKSHDGYFTKGDNLVSWAFGHILRLAEPHEYNKELKKWSFSSLPLNINLNDFKYMPISDKKKQLKNLVNLINSNEVDTIVHCGDADEEGQILIDEILLYANNKKPVERLFLKDTTLEGVKMALREVKDSSEFKGMSESGFARSQADWLTGINLTRAYTLKAQEQGYQDVLSVGRVQTPILSLIVARDKEHEEYKSIDFYFIQAVFDNFAATLKVKEKITQEGEAKEVKDKCSDMSGKVILAKHVKKLDYPPLPFNLLKLQALCSKKFGYKPDKTLEITQNLREKYDLITYNRSDCQYLPENMLSHVPGIINAMHDNLQHLKPAIIDANYNITSKAWNDKNLTAHFAIIPTNKIVDIDKLTKDEKNVYELIAKRFLLQFYPPKKYIQSTVEIALGDYVFSASSKKDIDIGYESVEKVENDDEQDDNSNYSLENIKEQDEFTCKDITIEKRKTKPKAYYTIATLLSDLASVSKYVKNDKIKKLLIDKDKEKKGERGGIGTPATRSEHIKNLFTKGYIKESKKSIISTKKGRELIALSPTFLTTPDMTALWYEQQQAIVEGQISRDDFLANIQKIVDIEIKRVKNEDKSFLALAKSDKNYYLCPKCKKGHLIRRKGKKGYWWGCSEFKNGCKATYFDKKGKPDLKS